MGDGLTSMSEGVMVWSIMPRRDYRNYIAKQGSVEIPLRIMAGASAR